MFLLIVILASLIVLSGLYILYRYQTQNDAIELFSVRRNSSSVVPISGGQLQPVAVFMLGDSTIDNTPYVPYKKDVKSFIEQKLGNSKTEIFNYALDGSKIHDVETVQVPKLMQELAKRNKDDSIVILVSVGGNDLITSSFRNNNKLNEQIWTHYTEFVYSLIDAIKEMKHTQIILMNLYLPPQLETKWKHTVKLWNERMKMIHQCVVLDTYRIMSLPNDFVHLIEPSVQGGEKIADEFIRIINEER